MKKTFCLFLAFALVLGMAGCSGGVSQEEYDRLLDMNADLMSDYKELQENALDDSIKNAAVLAIAAQIEKNYKCEVAGDTFLQFTMETETGDSDIKAAYDDGLLKLQVIRGLLEGAGTGSVGESLESFESFYIKAIDSDNNTVFEMSYHPNSIEVTDISIGAKYLEQVSRVLIG